MNTYDRITEGLKRLERLVKAHNKGYSSKSKKTPEEKKRIATSMVSAGNQVGSSMARRGIRAGERKKP